MRYGFVGLGHLGGHLAASLGRAGLPLIVYDLDPKLAERHVKLGARLAEQGVIPTYTTPEQTSAFIRNEIAKWATVIKDGNVKAE